MTFEEWAEFDAALRKVVAFVEKLETSQYAQAEVYLRMIRQELDDGAKSESEVKYNITKDTTWAARFLVALYENHDFSRWSFVPGKDISTDFCKSGLSTPKRGNVNIPEPISRRKPFLFKR